MYPFSLLVSKFTNFCILCSSFDAYAQLVDFIVIDYMASWTRGVGENDTSSFVM